MRSAITARSRFTSRATRRTRDGSRRLGAGAGAREGERRAQRDDEHRFRRGERVRLSAGEGARRNHVRHDRARSSGVREDEGVCSPGRCAATRRSTSARCGCSRREECSYTASCSFHLTKPLFLEMLQDAAADSGRRIAIREIRGQPLDHPEILTIPETGYIKGRSSRPWTDSRLLTASDSETGPGVACIFGESASLHSRGFVPLALGTVVSRSSSLNDSLDERCTQRDTAPFTIVDREPMAVLRVGVRPAGGSRRPELRGSPQPVAPGAASRSMTLLRGD